MGWFKLNVFTKKNISCAKFHKFQATKIFFCTSWGWYEFNLKLKVNLSLFMYKKEFVVLYDHGNGKTIVEFLLLHSKCFPALVTDFLELLYCPLRIRFGPAQSSMQAVQAVLAREKEGAARFLNFQSCFQ